MEIIDITEKNALEESLFCIKNPKNPGFNLKLEWLKNRRKEGLRLKILKVDGEPAGFIEYVPGSSAWRPVNSREYLFIHCLWVFPKKFYQQGIAGQLIEHSLEEAERIGLNGVSVQVSKGSWMVGPEVFTKYGFKIADKKDRFQLLVKKIKDGPDPSFYDWDKNLEHYSGLHLIYVNQCPLFTKSVDEMKKTAKEFGFKLEIKVLSSPAEAQSAPSGYGVYSLVYDGRLLTDHYISNTRFRNILTREING